MSYQAGEVATKLLQKFETDSTTISPQRAAFCSLRDLGYMKMTRGSFRHEFGMFILDLIPTSWSLAIV